MASLIYKQHYANGTSQLVRRKTKQGRRPSGLGPGVLVRLYADDLAKMGRLAERMGQYWNLNEFVRQAVREKLGNSVYTELLKT